MNNHTPPILRQIALTIALLFYIHSGSAAVRTWTGNGSDANWSTAANWDTGVPASPIDVLIFPAGAARLNNTNDLVGLAVTNVNFFGGGYTLNGNAFTNIGAAAAPNQFFTNASGVNIINCPLGTAGTVNPRYWFVSAGTELQLREPTTNNAANGSSPIGWLSLVGGGTVRIMNSARSLRGIDVFQGTVIVDGANALLDATGGDPIRMRASDTVSIPAAIVITNNGTLRASANIALSTTNNFLPVGAGAKPGATNRIEISSGTLELYGSATLQIAAAGVAGGIGIVNQNGGLVWGSGGSANVVTISSASGSDGTYNLNGGTLWIARVQQGTALAANAAFNFNGGTLKPTSSTATFLQGLATVNVQSGGAIIDTTNLSITIGQNLQAGSPSGGLTKLGTGTLALTGTCSYTGNTAVSNGTLFVNSSTLTGGGNVVVADGATLSVTNTGSSMPVPALTMGSSGASTLQFNFPGANPGTPTITAASLTANGSVTVNITGLGLTVGTIDLIQFTTASGLANFLLGTLPPGVSATLVTTATTVSLNISSVVKTLAWSGSVNNQWDTSTTNWVDSANGNNPTNYAQSGGFGDQVTFDDTATGPTNVNVGLTVTPVTVTFNNSSLAYSVSGSGKISGGAKLTKTGSSSLTLNTANDYNGGSVLNGGAIYLGNNAGLGLGSLSISSGALASDSTAARTVGNAVIVNAASGIQFGDPVNTGVLTLSGGVDLAAGGGRTLYFYNDVILTGSLTNGGISTKSGPGTLIVKGQVVEGAQTTQAQGDVIIDGGQVLNTGIGWRFQNNSGSLLRLIITNGGSFTMTNLSTGGNLRLGQAGEDASSPYLVDIGGPVKVIALNNGTGVGRLYLGYSGGKATAYLRSGGVLTCNQIAPGNTNNVETELDLDGGTIIPAFSKTDFMEGLTNAFVLNGGVTVDTANLNISINQPLLASGSGGLTKIGGGALTLGGVSTYTGNTVVSAGKLILAVSNVLAASSINVANNATNTFLSPAAGVKVSVPSVTADNGATLEAQFTGTTSNPTMPAGSITNLVLNGVVKLNVTATGLTDGKFPVIGYGNISGSGSLVVGQLPQGITATIVTNTVNKTIDLAVTIPRPTITTVFVSGGDIVLLGTNGPTSQPYYVLASTNVALPLTNWTSIATNSFGATGQFSFTNAIDPGVPRQFYLLQVP